MMILGKRYTTLKYVSVVMISIGITVCTVASGKDFKPKTEQMKDDAFSDYFWWLIAIMTFALFASARMGLYQEVLFKTYGKHPREALFFTHFLPLPGYILLYRDIITHIDVANKSTAMNVSGITIPIVWFCIIGNVLTQCKITRKFLSILISIFYFRNPFTLAHWFGTILVFGGTLMYSDIFNQSEVTEKTKIHESGKLNEVAK